MKNIYFFCLLILSSKMGAQNLNTPSIGSFESQGIFNEPWLLHLNAEGKKIREISYTSSKHPKDFNYTAMNLAGQVTERKYTNRWGVGFLLFNNFIHQKNEYENGELVKVEILNEKAEVRSLHLYEYNFARRLNHSQTFKEGKKVSESFTDFNTDTTQKEYRGYKIKNKKQVLNLKYEYDYYPDKQKKETRQYDRKNKLKYTWKYDCNQKGEIAKKETQVCKNTGQDNKGHIIDVIFSTNDKGKKTKNIHTYYMFNGKKIFVSFENYLIEKGKEIKLSEIHVADSLEPYYCFRSYDKKGRVVLESKQEYEKYLVGNTVLRSTSHTLYRKGKLSVLQRTSYNEKGLPIETESMDSKNKCVGKAVYIYYGDASYTIGHYNKKEKLTEVFTAKVTYF